MANLRREQLREYWTEEAMYGDDWRDDLTPEELDYVSALDRNYDRSMLELVISIITINVLV